MSLAPIRPNPEAPVTGVSAIVRDITERRLSEQLRASLEEKEVLMQEIQHRVKNNLQVVSSLLHLQSAHVSDAQARASFADCENRVRSMALVHEMLYQSANMSSLDCATYMRDLIYHLLRPNPVSKDVDVQLDVGEHITLGADVAIPCALIVNELVSNALQHAFPNGRRYVTTESACRSRATYRRRVSASSW
jgi:two-component sensor histidine kinase